MKSFLISRLVQLLVSMLTPELMRKFIDVLIDFVEKEVKGSKSSLDDKIVLPICSIIRETFNVNEDN